MNNYGKKMEGEMNKQRIQIHEPSECDGGSYAIGWESSDELKQYLEKSKHSLIFSLVPWD